MSDGPNLKAIAEQLEAIRVRLDALLGLMEESRQASLSAPRRNWRRFSLRTLLIAITVFACWLGYEVRWIVQRRAMLRDPQVVVGGYIPVAPDKVPWIVRILNEPEITSLTVSNEVHQRAVRLFPEAIVASQAPPAISVYGSGAASAPPVAIAAPTVGLESAVPTATPVVSGSANQPVMPAAPGPLPDSR